MKINTKCFDIFRACVTAIHEGELIHRETLRDKEFHFQNWCETRISSTGVHFEGAGRNIYPDYCLVEYPEGYEIKGLAYPGRERDYDANSNVPTRNHNGRMIFYIFGRYPNDTAIYASGSQKDYPVIDLVVCHGDFLNAQHNYVHKNKHISGFGTYGDIMIRDRKMYVVPTPFALTKGTAGLATLIVPDEFDIPEDFETVGKLERIEGTKIVIGYSFDLRRNTLKSEIIDNPDAGKVHRFKACRIKGQSSKAVEMIGNTDNLEYSYEDE